MRAIRSAWQLFMAVKTLLLVALLALSLSLNAAMFAGGKLYGMGSKAFEAVTGRQSIASLHASEVADLSDDLVNERRANRKLQGEVADLSDDLVNERRMAAGLRGQLDEATQKVVSFRGKRMAVSEAVELTADTIDARATRTATRSVGSVFGEAVPYFGTAVIVGVTALEVKDLCDTLKDMDALRQAFNPDLAPSEESTTVCALEIPTREELWASVKASPRAAWEKARELTPTLEEIRSVDLPDLSDHAYWEKAGGLWEGVRERSSSAVEGVGEWISGEEAEGN